MAKYKADINGQSVEFEAANDAAAGRYIDSQLSKGGATPKQEAPPVAEPVPPTGATVSPLGQGTTRDLPPVSPEVSASMGALLRGDPGARERVQGFEQGRQLGPGATAGLALQQGTLRNFGDELGAAGAASGLPVGTPPILSAPIGAARMAFGDQGARDTYTGELSRMRGVYEGAGAANPVTQTVGEIAGGIAGPMPGSSIPAMAGVAAADSALAGAGAGETAGQRATGAGVGAAIGGAFGTVLGYGGRLFGMGNGLRGTGDQVEGAAASKVADALDTDLARLTPAERAARMQGLDAAYARGQPVVVADAGGETVGRVAKTAANVSPDADNMIRSATRERFTSQADRSLDWWDGLTGTPNAMSVRDRLREAAKAENGPRYKAAYAEGQSVWNDRLAQLTASPTVQKAMKDAAVSSADEAARAGTPTIRNPFVAGEDGMLTLPKGTTPSLEFWDHVQRSLRRASEAAPRGGDEARSIEGLRRTLNEQLDAAVPKFGETRSVARGFFGAEDALEAGQGFLDMSLRAGSQEARAAFASMSPAEKKLFQTGVTESVRNRLGAVADNQEVARILNTPEMRSRLALGLGERRAQELTDFLVTEKTMSQLKNAIGAQSSTARQLTDMGMVGAGAGIGAGAGGAGSFIASDGSPQMPSGGAVLGALAGALAARGSNVNRQIASRVAEMLLSPDPAVLQRGLKIAQKSEGMRNGLNKLAGTLSRAAGQQAGAAAGEY